MKFLTKRFVLSVGAMGATVWLMFTGHMTAEWYGLTMLGCIAGHHAEDLIKAWRGNANPSAS